MITRVQVKNFRSLADVDVELGPVTVLVGRNGAGKSAFLDVLRFVRDALGHGLENAITARHGIASLRRWSAREPYQVEIALTVEAPNFWGEYSFALVSEPDGAYRVGREKCCIGPAPLDVKRSFEIEDGKWSNSPQLRIPPGLTVDTQIDPTSLILTNMAAFSGSFAHLRQTLWGSFYNIIPNLLREPQKPSSEKLLADHGENLASVIRRLSRKGKSFPRLLASLAKVVEGVSDLRVREVGGYLVTELKHDDLGDNSTWFELDQESDGTLRMLGMLVALNQVEPPFRALLALEEPENAVHPGALAVLSDVLREAALRHQILITTQSPDLISRFNVDELRVVERVGGITQIGPVDEAQRETINEQLFSAGDLLRIEGLRRDPVEITGGRRA